MPCKIGSFTFAPNKQPITGVFKSRRDETIGNVARTETRKFVSTKFQGESSSLYWLTKGKQLCEGITVLTQLYCLIYIYIYISTTCFGPYGHLQVGYEIRRKTIYNMVHYIHECGVSGGRDLVFKDMEVL